MIIQKDLEGNEIKRYKNIRVAAKENSIEYKGLYESIIGHNLNTGMPKSNQCKGFLWEKEGYTPPVIPVKLVEKKCTYRIVDIDTEEEHTCGKTFMSEGNWNRYCCSCQELINRKASVTNLRMKLRLMPTNLSSRTPRIEGTILSDLMWM